MCDIVNIYVVHILSHVIDIQQCVGVTIILTHVGMLLMWDHVIKSEDI